MARIINTTEISFKIEEIIKSSSSYVVIVCPFFQIHDRLKNVIIQKLQDSGFRLYIATREIGKKEVDWLTPYKNAVIEVYPNLHAKYYFNEKEGLVTSMNLYTYSMVNNIEIGVHFSKNEDQGLMNQLIEEYRVITNDRFRLILGIGIKLEDIRWVDVTA